MSKVHKSGKVAGRSAPGADKTTRPITSPMPINQKPKRTMNHPLHALPSRPSFTLWLALSLLLPSAARAETLVGGPIANQNWTKDKSPYLVTNDVYVSGSLTIREGVEVRFASNYVFEAAGRLRAVGTAAEPIHFHPADTNVGWQGILFRDAVPGSYFVHTIIEGSKNSGVRIGSTPPAFTNCWIRGNTGPNAGGGVSASAVTSNLIFHACTVSENTSADKGGGIYADLASGRLTLQRCVVAGNRSGSHGGGVWADARGGQISLDTCSVIGNQANAPKGLLNAEGGGLLLRGQIQVESSSITDNICYARCDGTFGCSVAAYGGGVIFYGDTLVLNTAIQGNRADAADLSGWPFYGEAYGYGAGICHWAGKLILRNSLVVSNTIVVSGNATYARGGGVAIGGGNQVSAHIVNSTIYKNDSFGLYNHDAEATIQNSIFYFNNQGDAQLAGQARVTFSNVQLGFTGDGNLAFNPSLCPDNWSLLAGSPCIDAGHPGLEFRDSLISSDDCSPYARGTVRNDMGAYGGPGVAYWTQPRAEPVIRLAPDNTIGFRSQPVALHVLATGQDILNYQWFRDGAPLAGQTNALLTIPAAALGDVGAYVVEVRNDLGSVTSAPVRLGVAQLEAVTEPLDQGRPRLRVRHGQAGEKCAIYSRGALPPGEGLTVPGAGAAAWELRAMVEFATSEATWTDPRPLAAGEARYYGVLPAP